MGFWGFGVLGFWGFGVLELGCFGPSDLSAFQPFSLSAFQPSGRREFRRSCARRPAGGRSDRPIGVESAFAWLPLDSLAPARLTAKHGRGACSPASPPPTVGAARRPLPAPRRLHPRGWSAITDIPASASAAPATSQRDSGTPSTILSHASATAM
ncbi:hypothetical protein X942_5091 [Burkholderia pseudomallei MSHR5596]|nr:hypothetical protein X942_5091 [Burkholderia pseudomallei MSHR5596]